MAGSRRSWIVIVLALAGVAAAIWAVMRATRPEFAAYDSPGDSAAVPAPPAGSSVDSLPAPGQVRPASDTVTRPVPRRTSAVSSPRHDTVAAAPARPHRSDNYGGYGGYGSRERRSDPNAK